MSILALSSISAVAAKPFSGRAGIYLPGVAAAAMLALYALTDSVLLSASGITLENARPLILDCAGLAAPTLWVAARRLDSRLGSIASATGFFIALSVLGVMLNYCVTALSYFPLEDANILKLDYLLGFDWHDFVASIDRYPLLCSLLGFSYDTIWLQVIALAIAAVLLRDHETADALMLAVGLSLFVVNVMAFLIPTVGVTTLEPHDFANLKISGGIIGQHDYLALRDKSLMILDFNKTVGLVTFPSFHAVIATTAALAARRIPYFFGPFLVLNTLMIISTLTHGGHYLVDVIVGSAVAFASWRSAVALAAWSGRRFPNRAVAPVPMEA
jgi:membrane-associated phospholipid phosphatase